MQQIAGWTRGFIAVVTVALSHTACGDAEGRGEDEDPRVMLDVNLFLGRGGLSFDARERDRPCDCAGEYPQPGECSYITDAASCTCAPAPATCLREFRVERDGKVIASGEYDHPELGGDGLTVPELESTDGNVLVLEGCGGSARVPLPRQDAVEAVVTSISHDDDGAIFHWEPGTVPATGLACVGGPLGGPCCRGVESGETTVPAGPTYSPGWVYFAQMSGGESVDTPIGAVRLWQLRSTELADVVFPAFLEDGRLSLPATYASLALDSPDPPSGPWDPEPGLMIELAALELGPPQLLELDGTLSAYGSTSFHYRAGETEDSLTIGDPISSFSAVFPHVEPTGQLVIGDALLEGEANVYQLDFGPVTLESDTGVPPLELTVSVTLELPTISQPPLPPVTSIADL